MRATKRLNCKLAIAAFAAGAIAALAGLPGLLRAQETEALQPGEAFVTRFSGTTKSGGTTVIDLKGTSGSIVDLRNPAQPPQGQHWLNEPQRLPVTAEKIGQIFGVALDDAPSPSIYVTATSAFGLHRTADVSDWMPGQWGPGGGPGTVWKLDAASGYKQPTVFAHIGVNDRTNTGAGLGNIAYDKWNRQFYVSDLETGLIHRLQLDGGNDIGQFDHGLDGRNAFLDASTGEQKSLPQITFDPASRARITDCSDGEFSKTPSCWNFADFRRRVWGLGVRKDEASGQVRLYYAVWSSQGFGNPDYAGADDEEKRNSLWSIALTEDGDFDTKTVRREFFLPDFFTNPADIARAGRSHPVSDIAFCKCKDEKVMIVSERGGVRNLGLDAEEPFADPYESRVLRYKLDDNGVWQPEGRYDVGFYDRKNDREPFIRANSSGGVDFGFGYGPEWAIDKARLDRFIWMTGDALCSPHGPCFNPDIGKREDGSHVHGAQGTPVDAFAENLPAAATQPYPANGVPYPPTGPRQSYMFDTDINLDASNNVIMDALTRNDATKIGDIEIYQPCADVPEEDLTLVDEPPEIVEPPIVDDTPEGEDQPDLEKVKDGPAQCNEGGICTFTITITNLGPGVWSGPLWETDTLPPGAILWNYSPQPEWICAQAAGTDIVSCTHDWVTLNPGDSVSLVIDVLLPWGLTGPVDNCVQDVWLPSWDPNDPAVILIIEQSLNALGYPVGPVDGILDVVTMNSIMVFQADNGLPVTGIPDRAFMDLLFGGSAGLFGDANPANDMDCHTVDIIPAPPAPVAPAANPDPMVRKFQRTGQCLPGGLCRFELWFANRGPVNWTGVPALTDTLPRGSSLVASTAPWICTQAGNAVTCNYPMQVTLAPNGVRRVILTVRMPRNLQRGAQNCVAIAPGVNIAGDPNNGNNRECIPVRVAPPPAPDIQTLKFQTEPNCVPGDPCPFDLWFINRGPGNWKGKPKLTDMLPAGATLKSASSPWNCSQKGRNVSCERPQVTLRPGRAVKVTLTVELPDNLPDNARNCARIPRMSTTRRDPVPQNNEHCVTVSTAHPPEHAEPPAQPVPVEPVHPPTPSQQPQDTRTEKKQLGPCRPGKSCLFELKFFNESSRIWSGRPKITDQLPADGFKLGSWVPSTWKCTQAGSTISCEHSGAAIPPHEHVSLTMTLTMPEHIHTNMQNCVGSEPPSVGPPDPNPGNDRHCVPIDTVTPGFTPSPPSVVTPEHCPPGTYRRGNECIRPPSQTATCPKGTTKIGNKCYSCPKGYYLKGTKCYSRKRTCPKGYYLRGKKCYPRRVSCPPGTVRRGRACVRIQRRCPQGYIRLGNVCIRIPQKTPRVPRHEHYH